MSNRSCWNVSRSVWTNALRWVKNSSLRRWAVFFMLTAAYFPCFRGCRVTLECVLVFLEHSREAVLPWKEYAGPAASGALHHSPARSILLGTVDGRICLPESSQVRVAHRQTLMLCGFVWDWKSAEMYRHHSVRDQDTSVLLFSLTQCSLA